jgi:hypothetical protein
VLPAEAQTAGSSVGQPVALSGGFVLPGVVVVKSGHRTGGEGCGGSGDKSEYQGALWWSRDGITWSRDSLSGATPTYSDVSMDVLLIDGHTVMAAQTMSKTIYWISADGKTWTRIANSVGDAAIDRVTARDRGLMITGYSGDGCTRCTPELADFAPNDSLVTLKPSGDGPSFTSDSGYLPPDWQTVLGPTGLLVTLDGTRFWMGIPTAG